MTLFVDPCKCQNAIRCGHACGPISSRTLLFESPILAVTFHGSFTFSYLIHGLNLWEGDVQLMSLDDVGLPHYLKTFI